MQKFVAFIDKWLFWDISRHRVVFKCLVRSKVITIILLLIIIRLAVRDWIAKGAAQRGRTEGAVRSARRSASEHDPCMTSKHSTTARWNKLGVNFTEGGKSECPGKTLGARLRSIETQPTYDLGMRSRVHRGGRHVCYCRTISTPQIRQIWDCFGIG